MPSYSYYCKPCDNTQLVIREITQAEPDKIPCEKCGEKLQKLFHSAPVIFRGNGWATKE
jgi:putative FmdB family regulatory protein